MRTPSKEFKEILELLNNYEMKSAAQQIKLWEAQSNDEFEIKQILHLRGVHSFFMDNLKESERYFRQAAQIAIDYLDFHMDFSSLLYASRQWSEWRVEYTALEDLMDSEEAVESPQAWILLSKFYEEEGLVSQALKALQMAFNQSLDLKNPIRKKVLAQLLRIESTFLSGKNVGSYYSQLIQIQKTKISFEFEFEVEHALMLGELALIGPQHASERLLTALKNKMISQLDSQLLLSDFVEECLINNYQIPAEISKRLSLLETDQPFEQVLLDLCQSSESDPKVSIGQLMKLASQLSIASYIRILTLSLKILPDASEELKNKLHLILTSIDSDSRHCWTLRMDNYLKTSQKRVLYDDKSRSLKYENKAIDLSRKRGMLLFIEALSKNPDTKIEDMIQAIWESDFSPDHFHRLRMTAHRMNKVIYDLTSVDKAIEVNSERVRVKPNLIIETGSMA